MEEFPAMNLQLIHARLAELNAEAAALAAALADDAERLEALTPDYIPVFATTKSFLHASLRTPAAVRAGLAVLATEGERATVAALAQVLGIGTSVRAAFLRR